ncbi:beta-galactosidase GalA [Cohnella sp. GCM10027633]|uniref:beta-galactosidase GalA n=1 Tax=unclassified Cohnella TaxID=2636738 RepID=UPI0036297BD2
MTGAPRCKTRFDEDWMFHKGDIPIPYAVKGGMTGGITDCGAREEGEWLEIAYVDKETKQTQTGWKPVRLPHDWGIEGQYVNDENLGSRAGSHGYLPTGVGVYRKRFQVAADQLGRVLSLQFDGVTGRSTVWVNGHLIGERFGGSTSFAYDLSDVLRYGDEGDNIVLVKVDATDYEGWWYEGCGIYRHVWLESTDSLHVARWGTYVTTPEVSEAQATVRVETRVNNASAALRTFELRTFVDGGEPVVRTHEIEGLDELVVSESLSVPLPKLWSPEHPNLYTAIVEIYENGAPIDRYETAFGIRTIAFDVDRGFVLNGEPYLIKGTSNHQDFAGVGVALPDSLAAYKLKLLKEMGCNAYRSAHQPPSPELLDLCDRIGLLVMDENRKLDSSARGLSELTSMIVRDRNHPSIVLWSLENEEVLEGTVMGARIVKTMAETARKLDPTRPTLAAMNHGWDTGGYVDSLDIVGYNYGHRGADVDGRRKSPNRRIVGSESASYTTTRGAYEDDPVRGYASSYGTGIPSWGCTPAKSWGDVLRNRFLSGVFIWTGFDYRGEPTPYEWPCINAHFGMMDTCGFPKDVYYMVQAMWTEEPIVHLLPHWNWEGREGETMRVVAYTNCDAVELFLNGKSIGERRIEPLESAEWDVAYEPGELKAIGRRAGVVVAEGLRVTTGKPHAIRLEPDRTNCAADGTDVVPVRVSVVDERGNVVPYADNEVAFRVEGAGSLLGVGNGNPSSHESDLAGVRRTFNGYALALLQAGTEAGALTLQASAAGLLPATVVLQVVGGERA